MDHFRTWTSFFFVLRIIDFKLSRSTPDISEKMHPTLKDKYILQAMVNAFIALIF